MHLYQLIRRRLDESLVMRLCKQWDLKRLGRIVLPKYDDFIKYL